MNKVSFILPVYKVEKYLRQCVESLTCQTYRDIEIILVDDGSPDGCPALCDQLATEDSRIRVLHKENGGPSDARNAGLKIATGDYVIFVDSDDFWLGDFLGHIVSILDKTESDVLFFNMGYYNTTSNTYSRWPMYNADEHTVYSISDALPLLIDSGVVPMSAWCKAIKRNFYIDNSLSFPAKIYGEDIPWFVSLMLCAKKISFCNDYVYAYRQDNGTSITKTNKPKHVRDMKTIIEMSCSAICQADAEEDVKNNLFSFVAYNYCILLSQIFDVIDAERRQTWSFIRQYHFLMKYDRHPKVHKVRKLSSIIGLKLTSIALLLYKKIR